MFNRTLGEVVLRIPSFSSVKECLSQFKSLPLNEIYFAVPDLHGQRQLFNNFAEQAEQNSLINVVFLGDYVDRLPSFQLMEDLLELRQRKPDWVYLPGNHEAMCLEWYHYNEVKIKKNEVRQLTAPKATLMREWIEHGVVPDAHTDFFKTALKKPYYLSKQGKLLFVHAGVEKSLKKSSLESMNPDHFIWSRAIPSDYSGPLLVHGHTFAGDEPLVTESEVNLETRCWMAPRRPLSVGVFSESERGKLLALIEVLEDR